ncbi:MAG: pyridoxamine 5'-phosphate oxidase family protein [Treponema sp.]|jgi:nitroimidazol reductase NimA-like FMN-containing flavoprotein (pyridoxamine 5'-phosphate oxidase superfamily)|nr:pyridoxamine 5'-phosphate oxidase family protein [Treponema sp.]
MRRKDREMDRAYAEQVIDRAAFAALATVNDDGTPYCMPLSPVRDGEYVYFHCAREGKKITNMRARPKVCLTFVGAVSAPEGKFTLHYESAVVSGVAEEIPDKDEKIRALKRICARYTPGNMAAFDEAIERSLAVTGVWKVRIDEISGKKNG